MSNPPPAPEPVAEPAPVPAPVPQPAPESVPAQSSSATEPEAPKTDDAPQAASDKQ